MARMFTEKELGEMAQWLQGLLSKHKDLSLDPQHPWNCNDGRGRRLPREGIPRASWLVRTNLINKPSVIPKFASSNKVYND